MLKVSLKHEQIHPDGTKQKPGVDIRTYICMHILSLPLVCLGKSVWKLHLIIHKVKTCTSCFFRNFHNYNSNEPSFKWTLWCFMFLYCTLLINVALQRYLHCSFVQKPFTDITYINFNVTIYDNLLFSR
jgi:hypothetical protein